MINLFKEASREWRVILYLTGIAILAFGIPAFAKQVHGPGITGWQCGGASFFVEYDGGPGWNRARYHVVNPDAIPYDRSTGVPQYVVEWRTHPNTGEEALWLNGYSCVSLPPVVAGG